MSWAAKGRRRARQAAVIRGHDLTRFDAGDQQYLATCYNDDCHAYAEVYSDSEWHVSPKGACPVTEEQIWALMEQNTARRAIPQPSDTKEDER